MTTQTITATTTWEEFLAERFTDHSELVDITNHGMAAGFNGFIYSTELHELFDTFEDEIYDILEELGVTLTDLVVDVERWTSQEIAERAVWIAVKDYAFRMTN